MLCIVVAHSDNFAALENLQKISRKFTQCYINSNLSMLCMYIVIILQRIRSALSGAHKT